MSNRSGTAYQRNLDELFADSDDSELSDFEGFVKECISKLAIKFTLTVSLMTTSGRTEIEMTTPSRLPYNNIIMTGMAVFYVAGYLIEERRRWPIITASPRGQCSQ